MTAAAATAWKSARKGAVKKTKEDSEHTRQSQCLTSESAGSVDRIAAAAAAADPVCKLALGSKSVDVLRLVADLDLKAVKSQ